MKKFEEARNEKIKDMVVDAFNLQDWLSGTMSGGIDAPRILMDVNPVNDFTVSVKWRNQETCGLSDCRYHNTNLQPHIDTFTLNNNMLSMNGSEVFHVTGWEDDPDIMTKIEEFSQKYHVVI